MSQKLFRGILGAFIACSLAFTSIAGACPTMNNMSMSEMPSMNASGADHSCEIMNLQTSSPFRNPDTECCNFSAMMPCEATDVLVNAVGNKVMVDWALTETETSPVTVYPDVRRVNEPRLFYPSYILKSRIIYLQTSRLRI
ncbi:hypothetical protein [Paremcibacter congregatus]|nr:hypothetical protein [Paremcibacter congregatus]QDE27877.1 hypothetical protein FIV45_11630 [Paremcibacter congregatus]